MASTVVEPIAAALVAVINTVTVTLASGTSTLKGYEEEPLDFDQLPAGAVGVPEITRVGLDEAERQLGSNDWELSYPVSLYFDLFDAVASQRQMKEAVEAFIKAIDSNNQLAATVDDAKVTRSTPFFEEGRARPMIGYVCTVEILKQVP